MRLTEAEPVSLLAGERELTGVELDLLTTRAGRANSPKSNS